MNGYTENNITFTSLFDSESGSRKGKVTLCQRLGPRQGDSCDGQDMSIAPLILIFMSQFVAGIGVLLFFTLGGPYLDDNTKRKNIPIVFGTCKHCQGQKILCCR
jgi:hypothetical protein